MRFESFLGRGVRSFWATTYSFDLRLFDQYLLRRIAQNGLNAVVLVDHDKLASVWEHLEEGERYLVRQVGRRYLLRGVHPPGGGSFHPKTYLFVQADHAALLVASGNLTRDGIDHGRELFTTFTTLREEQLPTMRAWAQWMGNLVQTQDDELLNERWVALRQACPWMLGPAEDSELLSNQSEPLLEQLVTRLPDDVRELHLTAPFFDRDAIAVKRLLSASVPQRVVLYLGAHTSVHGPSLKAALEQVPDVHLRRYQPEVFVHGKLIGALGREEGILVSGSPNLSRAALTQSYADVGGNSEVAVLRRGSANDIKKVFESSGLDLVDVPFESLTDLEFNDDHPTLARPFLLRSAMWRDDGRIQLDFKPDSVSGDVGLRCVDSVERVEIAPDAATVESLASADPVPVLVCLVDGAGLPVSNSVVVDDPAALRETLLGSTSKSTDRPREIEGLEAAPLVQLVMWAHEKFIFDPDDTPAFQRAEEAAGQETGAEDPTEFWERYATEELQYDPRVQAYKPLTPTGLGARPVDELLRELQALLGAAPKTAFQRILRALTPGGDDEGEAPGTGTPWSMEARQRVRAFHLLMRWANAVADPRHALIAPDAPVVNYETLLSLGFLAWVNEALEVRQVRRFLLTLFNAFIGDAPGQGFLGRIDDHERASALAALDAASVEIAAGLAYAALTVPSWGDDIYDWQPSLQRGIELGVILPGPLSEPVVVHLTGKDVDETAIDELLSHRVDWVDEQTWSKRLAAELELPALVLERFNNPKVPLAARISGQLDFLNDPRILTVARRTADFKHAPAVAVIVGKDRFIYEPGVYARALIGGAGGQSFETDGPTDAIRLREIEEQGGALSELFHLARVRAAAA